MLDTYCEKADFVFNLAGVNRPKEQSEFMDGNFGFASKLLDTLKKHHNTCPVMLSSSIQATLIGRYGQSDYGKSKLAGEELFFEYGKECGAKVLVYRFPNLFGKWCRGSFTELLKTANCGQFSVNISKPGITKGEHWHNSKWEFFIVVSGHGLIQERKIGTDEVIEFEVSGEKIEAIHMLPGYTHNIINLSETENLVTVMWANEQFDPKHPDTFFEKVEEK